MPNFGIDGNQFDFMMDFTVMIQIQNDLLGNINKKLTGLAKSRLVPTLLS